jgi:two-component system response regulator NreC
VGSSLSNAHSHAHSGEAAVNDLATDHVRIVIADDHLVVRTGLRMLLDEAPGFQVVGEAGDVAGAFGCLHGHHPDVLLLDLNMPGDPSVAAIPQLVEQFPDVAIVILTMQAQPAFAREALRRGARGYVLKEAADTDLVEAIRAVAHGATYLTPALGVRLALEHASPDDRLPDELTPRELEILRLIVLGHTNNEIAEQLFLSVRTVESHRASVQQKLHCSTRAELVRYALDRGMLKSTAR